MIQGYTLTIFPNTMQYNMHNQRNRQKNLATSKAHILIDIIIQVLLGDTLESLSVTRPYVEGSIVPILLNN